VLGPDDVAAVERAHPEPLQRPFHLAAELVEPVVLDQQPEEVLVVDPMLVGEPILRERLVDVGPVGGVGVESLLALRLGALAGRADVHHRQPGLLGEREGAGVEGVDELLVVLGDHAGPAAIGAVELDQLDPQSVGDERHRPVQLGREPARHAPRPVRNLHRSACSSGSGSTCASGASSSGSSPLM
jgi:hypothetical protein